MKISSNIQARMTTVNMNKANTRAANAMKSLSSGLRINSAKDDAAGLAISNKLDVQIRGLDQANRNAMDGISLVQTGEGALNEVHSMLSRLKTLGVQGINGAVGEDDKEKVQAEIDQLLDEIKSIGERTDFNGIKLLNSDENIMIQTGANSNEALKISGEEVNIKHILADLEDLSFDDGEAILEKVDRAIETTSSIRGIYGALQNRLEHTINNLGVNEENMTASLSRILDADMAETMTTYTQNNIITQSGIAMLAQANQRPTQILQLLNS